MTKFLSMPMYNPISTYRLQFNRHFTFKDAIKTIPYLNKLGIKTIYASPVLKAVTGSMHGYDITDPSIFNPEIGNQKDWNKLQGLLKKFGMGWIQDIVPNHMAFHIENPWIYDVMLKGSRSSYYEFFDIIPSGPNESDKLMVPFLGKNLNNVIDDGEIILIWESRGLLLKYYDQLFPVSLKAYPFVLTKLLNKNVKNTLKALKKNPDASAKIIEGLYKESGKDKQLKKDFRHLVKSINQQPEMLLELTNLLEYRLVYWKETESSINYRRFFTINSLICLNIQNEEVFNQYHKNILKLVNKGEIQGLRIDHIDGLQFPGEYLNSLRCICGEDFYITIEKILEKGEDLFNNWLVQGTTGYDFLALVNNLLTNTKNREKFTEFYHQFTGKPQTYQETILKKKQFILFNRFKGELQNLTDQAKNLPVINSGNIDDKNLQLAIAAILIFCPVYKIYGLPSNFSKEEKAVLNTFLSKAIEEEEKKDVKNVLEVLLKMFMLKNISEKEEKAEIDAFFSRCMQFTGPLMAKGVEDTAFYTFNPFITHNEVGDSPGYFGLDTPSFHKCIIDRKETWPMTMNTTSSHDTKRGEDARARLNVLSDIPDKWIAVVNLWHKMNSFLITEIDSTAIPSRNDEYFIYQTLVAHWPIEGEIDDGFRTRVSEYLIKFLREAKTNTSWSNPNPKYEAKTLGFVEGILEKESPFVASVQQFLNKISEHGIINSLAQVVLKYTVPGVPDTFQGNEGWNFDFVDPDNRRPVHYTNLSKQLDSIISFQNTKLPEHALELWKNKIDGSIKHWFVNRLLQLRNKHSELFTDGSYIPVNVKGEFSEHIIAFYRHCKEEHLLVVLPLNTAVLPDHSNWENTFLHLPELLPHKWEHQLTGQTVKSQEGVISVNDCFETQPFGILVGIPFQPERRSGILMHITSLPSDYGVGGFGKEAYGFIDFLEETHQKYWQLLPLNISNELTGFSPYSSFSAFAGNVLFVNPEHLVSLNLLKKNDLKEWQVESAEKANYAHAEKAKHKMLDMAYRKYTENKQPILEKEFKSFKEKEAYWLNDFALFVALKMEFDNLPWNEWPDEFRDRKGKALKKAAELHQQEIDKICFGQYLFLKQWTDLKTYANKKGVEIVGDMPIYVSYDSADVWSQTQWFRLKENMGMLAMAGVPPDYFNANGQLWGMPLFHWEKLKKDGFNWWLQRIEKNLEFFDLLRLDHFRGFSAFWEVPADHETALNGQWVEGPATYLFDAIKNKFPEMPFIAEDLGQIDQPVYDLRDRYKLPGMKVLQFGFGDNMPFLQHALNNHCYNSIAYTGTHDNNTMKGWFRKEADKPTLKRYKDYTGVDLNEENCHTEFIKKTYASVAKMAIIPMQDWLGLDENHRMNFPSTTEGNWLWRMKKGALTRQLEKEIKNIVEIFGRY